ncbi:arsenical resistance operon transcriptional repressor ArsD [Anaerobacillus alkalidiazotrophicus]|uniref:Arsenical resistance operon transcriptional repressor ArsD n=1 Tax=Anaerobacillus alkalidiazotrophicus TaxID=472963 RepID=A0A1S2M146_9BACI|nr:arsenite efflux transporter metallochaperone ArsD [Anaerobacillus alkalidiazotrophicus]OIJ18418.1 arsenical resistance operon transcriptional repressor ArsD [Anaerobacillus alkalidiazotrophicus]OIJ19897.1 arsenical resistance operon transcriptional repressor ArsD [Anaerobacillus alkalidiazotrophicus]
MKTKIEIFDPALCCPTGVCGPDVDPELTRIARDVATLVNKGHDVIRYNLAQNAEPYVLNKDISMLMEAEGVDGLPATVVNGKIVKTHKYPSKTELATWLNIDVTELEVKNSPLNIDLKSI